MAKKEKKPTHTVRNNGTQNVKINLKFDSIFSNAT